MSAHICIVDDDSEIAELIAFYIKNEGFSYTIAHDGAAALKVAQCETIDLFILDVMMPELDGLEVCKRLREASHVPILMVSAKVEQMDKVVGLMTGADDYMEKPFHPLELIARVKALLRRAQMQSIPSKPKDDLIHIQSLIIDLNKHTVHAHEKEVHLTPIEFKILSVLASHPSHVFNSEKLFEIVWNEAGYGANKTVMVHVSNLREKLEQATDGEKIIETVWGVGYKIDPKH